MRKETAKLVDDHWSEIRALARELSIRRTLRAEEIAAILRGEGLTPPIRGERLVSQETV